ncbi:hypothetical protein [Nioella nitratireducens]|uniref:hypothetical protein n=1 Tax=Nioella nitratireducens TaxID=1287720 RepID=UPI0011BAD72D|nr:hypothetical protein [Nioella nitratireducens]
MTIMPFTKTAPAFAVLILSAGAVLADCPSNMSDTADSIFVSFDGFYTRFDRQTDGSVIEEEINLETGEGFRVHSIAGAFVTHTWQTQYGALVQGQMEVTEYAVGVENLPTLYPGQTWSGSTVRRHDDGTTNVETVDVRMDPETSINIGACSYRSWPILVTTTDDDGGDFLDRLTYLPTLGFAIYHGGAYSDEAFTPDTPRDISTEPPSYIAGAEDAALPPIPGNPTPAQPPAAPPSQPDPNK